MDSGAGEARAELAKAEAGMILCRGQYFQARPREMASSCAIRSTGCNGGMLDGWLSIGTHAEKRLVTRWTEFHGGLVRHGLDPQVVRPVG